MKRLAAQAEALCRAVANLGNKPLYILLSENLPFEVHWPDRLMGFTSQWLDLVLQPVLAQQGRWRGRGPAMVVAPEVIAADLAELGRPARRRCFAPTFFGVALHELSHILDAGPAGGLEPPADLVGFARAVVEAQLAGVTAPTNGPSATIPWRRHELGFIRVALHLAHRARASGVWLQSTDVFDATAYELLPTRRYAAALGDEPARLAGCPLADVRATPPPAPFIALWRRDMRRLNRMTTRLRRASVNLCCEVTYAYETV